MELCLYLILAFKILLSYLFVNIYLCTGHKELFTHVLRVYAAIELLTQRLSIYFWDKNYENMRFYFYVTNNVINFIGICFANQRPLLLNFSFQFLCLLKHDIHVIVTNLFLVIIFMKPLFVSDNIFCRCCIFILFLFL